MAIFVLVWVCVLFAASGVLFRVAHRRGRAEERDALSLARGQLLYTSAIRLVDEGGSHLPNAYVIEVYESDRCLHEVPARKVHIIGAISGPR